MVETQFCTKNQRNANGTEYIETLVLASRAAICNFTNIKFSSVFLKNFIHNSSLLRAVFQPHKSAHKKPHDSKFKVLEKIFRNKRRIPQYQNAAFHLKLNLISCRTRMVTKRQQREIPLTIIVNKNKMITPNEIYPNISTYTSSIF